MKIAVWYNLPSGGAKRALYHQLKGLAERGHVIETWSPPFANRTYLPLDGFVRTHVVPSRPVTFVPPPTYGIRAITALYVHIRNKISALDEHSRACAREINAGGFDQLFAHNCMFLGVGAIGRYVDVPAVLYCHEPFRHLYEPSPDVLWVAPKTPQNLWRKPRELRRHLTNVVNTQAWRIQMREEHENARAFGLRLVNSAYSRESILRAYGMDARVCYLGVDAEKFSPTGAPRENFVLGVGSITPSKGIDRAIRALATIPKAQRPPYIWIGNTSNAWHQAQLEKLAERNEVKVKFLVGVSDKELQTWMNRAAVFFYTPRLEPFGFTPLEANACETPVVTIAEGGIRETIRDDYNGIVVGDADPAALGQAVMKLVQDPALARAYGKNGRENVLTRWTWAEAVNRLETQLLQCVKRGTGTE